MASPSIGLVANLAKTGEADDLVSQIETSGEGCENKIVMGSSAKNEIASVVAKLQGSIGI